jgi:hypothetical protein
VAIGPDTVHGEQEQDFGRVFTLTAERLSASWQCIYGISPRGGGADGVGGGGDAPPHLSQRVTVTLF